MELDNFKYEKLDYKTYKERLANIEKNELLQKMDMQKRLIGTTEYNYGLYDYVIGHGQKDLFIIGGTHGSEIIGVDFVTQLLNQIPNLNEFDPNLITLHIIPCINPEGFDITTSTLQKLNNDNLQSESYDYYLRFRTDNVMNAFINLLGNKLKELSNKMIITPNTFLNTLKEIFKEKQWTNLCASNAIPSMKKFEDYINRMFNYNDFSDLMRDIKIGINFLSSSNKDDIYFVSALKRFEDTLFSDEFWFNIVNNDPTINKSSGSRLYQEKFQNMEITGTSNPDLSEDVSHVYETMNIQKGSQIKFDPTGKFINLNENTPYNPGIEIMNNGGVAYGSGPANNILNYANGPIGKPTSDPNSFTFAKENIALNSLFAESASNNRFAGALLYHGTGGMIYSKPYQTPENKELTDQIALYNNILSEAYKEKTNYKQIETAENTGYGDLLRQTYPGVLLIELSKMGGNPIAPYGDINNINNVMNDNFAAVNNLLATCNSLILDQNNIGR